MDGAGNPDRGGDHHACHGLGRLFHDSRRAPRTRRRYRRQPLGTLRHQHHLDAARDDFWRSTSMTCSTLRIRALLPLLIAVPLAAQQAAKPRDGTRGRDATITATQEYLKTGQARSVQMGDALAFPYGKIQPTLTCAPLRTCLIRLQTGETVLGAP